MDHDVFINCPFDAAYTPFFNAMLYTVVRSGYRMRCALEADDASENRLAKICKIIAECKFAVHDISRTDLDKKTSLPRLNMPLELGLFLGAKFFGGKTHSSKVCMIFDSDRFRYQKFISDIAGQDIHAHEDNVTILIKELSAWLRGQPGGVNVGGGQAVADEYATFQSILPNICSTKNIAVDELTFSDLNQIVVQYVAIM